MQELRNLLATLLIDDGDQLKIQKELKAVQKALDSAEFRYKRTLMDKEAITNILNASIVEIEKQKAVIDRQKREAQQRASIDRVRAEIGTIRTSEDITKITPLIWEELKALDIPFMRSGIMLLHEDDKADIDVYLCTVDGKSIASFKLPPASTKFSQAIYDHWVKSELFIAEWNEDDFRVLAESLVELQVIASVEQYMADQALGKFYLHYIPFAQGVLYVGNTEPLSKEDIAIVETLSIAFSGAYARYDDFIKLEAAKKKIELTLSELREAQRQLIQSEKMASLGELTAGIAHEIQNPLNFVNNFSEVNAELIDELKDEVEKGNKGEVLAIAKDIKENSEKIISHGKRADAIVKGMLQHSRQSTGATEPTDINALCDEYLRLAYHGVRARDKSFNAELKTNFDERIGKVNVTPQDIGRVVLNLITNAFYAVNEKRVSLNSHAHTYSPMVSVTTVLQHNKVGIVISDNGKGIPAEIKDKIFQPFFTTKPTGQGTGLGLSLAYDIVKAHGGNIMVSSEPGAGTTFTVELAKL